MIVSRSPGDPQVAPVIPIVAPSRAELWGRIQLARSVLAHRPSTPENWTLLTEILNGESITDLMRTTGGAA